MQSEWQETENKARAVLRDRFLAADVGITGEMIASVHPRGSRADAR